MSAASDIHHESQEGKSVASDWVVVDIANPSAAHEDKWDAPKGPVDFAEPPLATSKTDSLQLKVLAELTTTQDETDASKNEEEHSSQKDTEDDGDVELDVCFICDCTGSMGSYIKKAQTSMQHIVKTLSESHGTNLRMCTIGYRDHPPQDRTYVTCSSGFSSEFEVVQAAVQDLKAAGGGDGPEALTAALHEALKAPWRPNATKVCILIADAPPHGLEPHGDGFPDGDPNGHDPLNILREMATENIIVHAVGCEPALGKYQFARDFMCTVAELTGGQAIALNSADLLAEVIIHGCAEELGLSKLQRDVEQEVQRVQAAARSEGRHLQTSQAVAAACRNLHASGVTTAQVDTDGRMVTASAGHWGSATEKKTLSAVKADLCESFSVRVGCALPRASEKPRSAAAGVPAGASAPGRSSADGATRTALRTALISEEQVSRLVQRAQQQNRLLE